jgi:thiol-disulfide isomerase/thioredoxin
MEDVVLQAISFFISIVMVFATFYIPSRIMINQLYAGLVQEYRSVEMGAAIFAIFRFYVEDCKNNIANIAVKYQKKYEEQIKKPLANKQAVDYSQTLHFQRRLVSQFYWDMAVLRYEYHFPRLSKKKIKLWFTPREVKLLAILLHLAEPAEKVFIEAGDVAKPPKGAAQMNQLIGKLYKEVKNIKQKVYCFRTRVEIR